MSEFSTTMSPPSSTAGVELFYQKGSTWTQVFGVQSIPKIITPRESQTYSTLESFSEFAIKGTRKFESIEIECVILPEQLFELNTDANAKDIYEFAVAFPPSFKTKGATGLTAITWSGSLDVSPGELGLDDMIKATLTLGKSTTPTLSSTFTSTRSINNKNSVDSKTENSTL
ncbi:MAG: hypothetical protein RR623_03990 [Bacilli bacterium]